MDDDSPYPQLEPNTRAQLFERLLRAQIAARPVDPSGKFQAGPLKDKPYVSDHDATVALTPVLRDQGLVLTSSMLSSRDLETTIGKGERATRGWLYTAVVEFTLTDANTGYSITALVEGRALTDDNRGPVHAIANASRVYLMRLLQVPMAEPDQNQGNRRRSGNAPPQQQGGPQGERPVGNMADGRDRRIPEARGLTFKKEPSGQWVVGNGPTAGEELDLCEKCGKSPVLQVSRGRFKCIDALCGNEQVDPITAELEARQAAQRRADAIADEISIFRGTIDDMIAKGIHTWQLAAVHQADSSLPGNTDKWGLDDWKKFVERLKKNAPDAIRSALAAMAKALPADRARVAYLEQLVERVPPGNIKLILEAKEAAGSGWHDAVQELIEKVEPLVKQGELPMGRGQQKAQARR